MDTLAKLPKSYRHHQRSESEFRANLVSEEDVRNWIGEYSRNTQTSWNVKYGVNKSIRFVLRKLYVCHHTGYQKTDPDKKKYEKSKNLQCDARINIVIKNQTPGVTKRDKFAKGGLFAIIKFQNQHNHPLDTTEILSSLKPTDNVRIAFEKYFGNELGITKAMEYHESVLLLEPAERATDLTNAQINPTPRTVRYWHDEWRKNNSGRRFGGVLEKLRRKQTAHGKNGCFIEIQEEPFAVIVMTPLMQRAHSLTCSKEIVLIDSTSLCDTENHSVTFVMTPCAVGAIPLAIIITKGQTEEDYRSAFGVLAKFPSTFCGQGHPRVFITDDSDAQRLAVGASWPQSSALLCRYRLSRTIWRWLWEPKNCIAPQHRRRLYESFQKVLVAPTENEAIGAYVESCHTLDAYTYPNWRRYMEVYWERRHLWCLAWRDATSEEYQANNYCEISVRLYKDIILLRNKVHNVVASVDYTCDAVEKYYFRKLEQFINDSNSLPKLFFSAMVNRVGHIAKDNIIKISDNVYKFPTKTEEFYEVDSLSGFCSCIFGCLGKFCEHQAVVLHHYSESIPEVPPLDTETQYILAKLAFGENMQETRDSPTDTENKKASNMLIKNEPHQFSDDDQSEMSVTCEPTSFSDEDDAVTMKEICNLLQKKHESYGCSQGVLRKFYSRLKKCHTRKAFENHLSCAGGRTSRRHQNRAKVKMRSGEVERLQPAITRSSAK